MKEKQFDLGLTFGLKKAEGVMITGYEEKTVFVPQPEENYIFAADILRDLATWWMSGTPDGFYLFGPTGCGKSAALVHFCAMLNIPLYEMTLFDGMEFDVLQGRIDIVEGDTVYNYGALPLAMGINDQPGIFLANEIDQANEGVLTGLYEVLAGRSLSLDAGGMDVVQPKQGFRIAATGNTSMLGDDTGLYVGTRRQNLAFLDRFWKIKARYPSVEVETKILALTAPGLPETIRDKTIKVANDIREQFMGESSSDNAIELTMSTRTLVRWAQMTMMYHKAADAGCDPLYYALDRALLNAADSGTRKAITTIAELHIGTESGD